jgi:L-alanine-DL-glutamate epimerase-like enolase superfamily enzyme
VSASVPGEKRHCTNLGTQVKSDATLIRVETDNGLTGIGAALGTPPIVAETCSSFAMFHLRQTIRQSRPTTAVRPIELSLDQAFGTLQIGIGQVRTIAELDRCGAPCPYAGT